MTERKQNPVDLTNSELGVLRACAWKHHLRYERMLEPAGGQDTSGPLNVGTLMHHGIAEVYKTFQRMQLVGIKPSLDQLRAVVRKALDEKVAEHNKDVSLFEGEEADEAAVEQERDIEEAEKCLALFVENIALPRFERYAVVGVEVPFRVPLLTMAGRRSGDWLEGVMDAVFFDRSLQLIKLGEHKSTRGDAHVLDLQFAASPQAPLYTYALRNLLGPKLVRGGVVLNAIRKSYPREPDINKDGTVSVAACDTTQDIYRAALDRQEKPDWLTKAEDALHELNATGPYEGKSPSIDPKKVAKAQSKLKDQADRWSTLQQKQENRLSALPGIERFVAQHEYVVPQEQVDRAQLDAWNGARVIRLFRRGVLTPWRNGQQCHAYNRLCSYHSACVENVVEPGDLLVKREHRHNEVVEAGELSDLKRTMDLMGLLRE